MNENLEFYPGFYTRETSTNICKSLNEIAPISQMTNTSVNTIGDKKTRSQEKSQ